MNRKNRDISGVLPRLEAMGSYAPSFISGVICLAIGIGAYFALPFEPIWWIAGLLTLGLGAAYWAVSQREMRFAGWILMACLIAGGLARASWHSDAANTPKLPSYERSYTFSGWVEAVERSGKGERIVLRVSDVSRLTPAKRPHRVRIRVTTGQVPKAGQSVRILAAAKAPPGPVMAGDYDPARRAYFMKTGGFGFSFGPAEILPDAELGAWASLQRKIVIWRYSLAEQIHAAAPPETAGLQTALITGVRRYIPPDHTDALRKSGLAHILAISGLHMGLMAGSVFGAITFMLACIPALARRWDVRKPAAMIGILAAIFYLILSGASVATQRAFIMAVIVFLAVILDRKALSLRSVAVAALVTLWWHPEALVSAGFQMSFAAVTALIVTYQTWRKYRPAYKRASLARRGVNFVTSLSVTSAVAGLATAGFALFHFNRVAKFGLLGNLLAMPIFSLAVMPLAIISLLAMPFGLERWPLQAMGWAIGYIIDAASYVAALPGASFTAASAPASVLALFSLGFLALCLAKRWVRLGGIVVMGVSFVLWAQARPADIRISEAGQVAFWDGEGTLLTDESRGDRYGRSQFAQSAGREDAVWQRYDEDLAACDALACRVEIKGRKVSILKHPSEVPEECSYAEIVILSVREAGPVARRGCEALLIDARTLREDGAVSLYLSRDKIRKEMSKARSRNRPWSG